jgi:hypothetical protein
MWQKQLSLPKARLSDQAINDKYESGEQRIVTEANREKLPTLVEQLKKPGYMELRPFYQRRKRWDAERQSRLIESFIMNVPVPPVFLFERNFNSYEVMDGQQRITAISEFYENKLKLTGLERWPELNGRTYQQLPSKIRAGIDRRSISSVVLLKESAPDEEEAQLLRQLVFERLNTGGVKLAHQEIRNALYQSKFNDLLLELAKTDAFRECWGIPAVTETEEAAPSDDLLQNPMYKQMGDIELILRFFALRHVQNFSGGMQTFLTRYTIRAQQFTDGDLAVLRRLFNWTFETANYVFGELVFRPYLLKKKRWARSPHKAFYDAVMVGLSRHTESEADLILNSEQIVEKTRALFETHSSGTFTGRGNSKKDIENRIDLFDQMLNSVLLP